MYASACISIHAHPHLHPHLNPYLALTTIIFDRLNERGTVRRGSSWGTHDSTTVDDRRPA